MCFMAIFRPHAGAGAFFTSILVWGIGVGCFMAALNNYLSEIYHMNSLDRGWLDFSASCRDWHWSSFWLCSTGSATGRSCGAAP